LDEVEGREREREREYKGRRNYSNEQTKFLRLVLMFISGIASLLPV
jgi:hypothetical protein